MAVLYFSLNADFTTCTTIEAKIAKIDTIIDALLVTALTSVKTGNIIEYDIDTGQSRQRVQYSTAKSVTDALAAYEKMRQYYINKILGGTYRNIGSKNLNRRRY